MCGVDQCAGAGCGVRLNWSARTSPVKCNLLELNIPTSKWTHLIMVPMCL